MNANLSFHFTSTLSDRIYITFKGEEMQTTRNFTLSFIKSNRKPISLKLWDSGDGEWQPGELKNIWLEQKQAGAD